MRAVWVVAVACIACSRPKTYDPGACLPLQGNVRSWLTADPDGDGLYWIESVAAYDFESELIDQTNLVRFDFATGRIETVLDRVAGPLLFVENKLVALRSVGRWRAIAIEDRKPVQELTPDHLDVYDVEPLDRHTIALLASGDGRTAVYTLDLRNPRPEYLVDANVMLSTSGGRVFIRSGDDAFAVDAATRKKTQITVPKKLMANADGAVHVTATKMVAVQSMSSGSARTVVFEQRPWKLVHQIGSVLARTPPEHDSSFAWLLADGKQRELPTVLGGSTILTTTVVADQTWALIGYNSQNFIGDLATVRSESNVCRLPTSGRVTFGNRQTPARYALLGDRLFKRFHEIEHDASVQILDAPGRPTTVFIELKKEQGASDWAAMRKRVRDLHEKVTSLLGDREIMTDIEFADRQRAVMRWRRTRLGLRASVGMGDALRNEPEDFDVAPRDLINEEKDGRISCRGTLVNTSGRQLDHVTLRCSSNRTHVIDVGSLAVNASVPFDASFDDTDHEGAMFEAFSAGHELQVQDPAREARSRDVLDVALTVYRDTGLALDGHDVSDGEIEVTLATSKEFEARSDDERKTHIEAAYRGYERLRAIYNLEAKSSLTLKIDVELTDVTYNFDGTKLTRDD